MRDAPDLTLRRAVKIDLDLFGLEGISSNDQSADVLYGGLDHSVSTLTIALCVAGDTIVGLDLYEVLDAPSAVALQDVD